MCTSDLTYTCQQYVGRARERKREYKTANGQQQCEIKSLSHVFGFCSLPTRAGSRSRAFYTSSLPSPNPSSRRPLSMNIYENGTSSLYNIEIQHGTAAVLLLTVNSDVRRTKSARRRRRSLSDSLGCLAG